MKILIVDDIPDYVDAIEAYMEDKASVLKAYSFDQAKEALDHNYIDLAVIDIRLKDDDPNNRQGIDLVKLMKQKMPNSTIVVMSAYRDFDYAVEALNSGADYFLRKPINPDDFLAIVDKGINKKAINNVKQ